MILDRLGHRTKSNSPAPSWAQDIIFEVMPNGRLASLTLYSADGGRQRLEGGQLRGHASDLLRMRGDMMHGQEHDS